MTTEIDANLRAGADRAMEETIKRLQTAAAENPDAPFAVANKGLSVDEERWHCAGALEVGGVVWWTLHMQMDFAPPHVRFFNAQGGPDWAVTVGIGAVAGSFVVPVEKLTPGEYNFKLGQLSFEVGGIGVDFFDLDHRFLGTCYGVIGGAGAASISGQGTMSKP